MPATKRLVVELGGDDHRHCVLAVVERFGVEAQGARFAFRRGLLIIQRIRDFGKMEAPGVLQLDGDQA
jgi:hypothetical protein